MLSCTRLGRIPTRLFSTTSISLSGHSKWSTIKHDKAKNDLQKNLISNRCANAISVAAKGEFYKKINVLFLIDY